jgi:hypothetical protein
MLTDSIGNRIEIWERFRTKNDKVISWEKSFDGGHTWTNVLWIGEQIPFVVLDWRETEETDAI